LLVVVVVVTLMLAVVVLVVIVLVLLKDLEVLALVQWLNCLLKSEHHIL
jgi:hypothetical protein|tara:strand:- start:600 stop:746 length:147 start_codon:yes stop_codon:yes gene_type:complete